MSYLPKRKEIHQLARYRRVLHRIMDAHLLSHEIIGRYNWRWGSNYAKMRVPLLTSIVINGEQVWRAVNKTHDLQEFIDPATARLHLREYFHIKDGVSNKALDYAETIDE